MRKKTPLFTENCGGRKIEVHDDFNDENGMPCEIWIPIGGNEFAIIPISELKNLLKKINKFKPQIEE